MYGDWKFRPSSVPHCWPSICWAFLSVTKRKTPGLNVPHWAEELKNFSFRLARDIFYILDIDDICTKANHDSSCAHPGPCVGPPARDVESVRQACWWWNLICLAVQHGGDSDLCAHP